MSKTGAGRRRNDPVNPKHYTEMKISPVKYIVENDMGFLVGNIIKYVSRYKSKNGLEDLKKARWYLNYLIKRLKNGKE